MLNLNIFSFDKFLFFENILKIYIFSIYGELCIYPNHSPLLIYTKPGIVFYNGKEKIIISKSLVEVKNNIVTVFSDVIKYDLNVNTYSIKIFSK